MNEVSFRELVVGANECLSPGRTRLDDTYERLWVAVIFVSEWKQVMLRLCEEDAYDITPAVVLIFGR